MLKLNLCLQHSKVRHQQRLLLLLLQCLQHGLLMLDQPLLFSKQQLLLVCLVPLLLLQQGIMHSRLLL